MSYIVVMTQGTGKRADKSLPPMLRNLLKEIGANIKLARKKRSYSEMKLARLAHTSRRTIQRIEMGEPGVGIGIFASVLFILQLESDLKMIASPDRDDLGNFLMTRNLPDRIRDRDDKEYDF